MISFLTQEGDPAQEDINFLFYHFKAQHLWRHWIDDDGLGLAQCNAVGSFHCLCGSLQLPQAALDLLPHPAAVGPLVAGTAMSY